MCWIHLVCKKKKKSELIISCPTMSYHGCFVDGFLFFFINKDGLKRKVPNYKNLNTSTIHHTIDVTTVRRKDQGDLPNLILPDTIILFIFEHKCLHLTRLLSASHKKVIKNIPEASAKLSQLQRHTFTCTY